MSANRTAQSISEYSSENRMRTNRTAHSYLIILQNISIDFFAVLISIIIEVFLCYLFIHLKKPSGRNVVIFDSFYFIFIFILIKYWQKTKYKVNKIQQSFSLLYLKYSYVMTMT